MRVNIFVLTSPDLQYSPFVEHLATDFNTAVSAQAGSSDDASGLASMIVGLHQEVLTHAQKRWYQRLPAQFDFQHSPKIPNRATELAEQLNANSPWLVHDPLLCHLLPLWKAADSDSLILLHYSEPLECALRLQKQWRFPLSVGLALWESYLLAASRYLDSRNCVLVSSHKLRRSSRSHLKSVAGRLKKLSGSTMTIPSATDIEASRLVAPLDDDYKHKLAHVQKSQARLFKALEKGNLKRLRKMRLSDASRDLLDYYGRMRVGFETLRESMQSNANTATSSDVTINDRADAAQPDANTGNLCRVHVLLKGMSPLEFVAEADSPILAMLQQHLMTTAGASDELIYLNSDGPDSDATYFMASSLLAVETEPLSQTH